MVPTFNVDLDDYVKPSMPYDTLFVHTIIHPTRASEHATAAITRDTRDGFERLWLVLYNGRQALRREIGRWNQRVQLDHPCADYRRTKHKKCIISPAVPSKTRAVS
ncbi:uncharacterized protein N7484_010270 [Penicillium longicatenatum]|uniref:uncharacterized protein n=1 Tax=Penicillium longicatenatum TaxID=1561947 RepID=UPI00254682FD|nr:uncharacterized protein N7484_010270 [Penicillium longicatenatum]KAJ5636957.1 hypothetical protein N7484_010270 [Penicillium longicatenatum]